MPYSIFLRCIGIMFQRLQVQDAPNQGGEDHGGSLDDDDTATSRTGAAAIPKSNYLLLPLSHHLSVTENTHITWINFFSVLFRSKLSFALSAMYACFFFRIFYPNQVCLFVSSLIAIAPLAERLGYVTEQLAFYTGPAVGGLVNATFGNATELIICMFALHNKMLRVVQLSLLGSILSNMLLVLGCAFFCGGVKRKEQKFSQGAAVVNSGLLLMAVMGLLFPAVLHSTHTEVQDGASELNLSRFTSCIMLVAYAWYLYFHLKSHREMYESQSENNDENSEEEEVELSVKGAVFWLALITYLISWLSNILVYAIEDASEGLHMPMSFVSVIVLPIVGNAAEHASAIMFAMKNKLDMSLAIAIGSSTQISMFVIPCCVVIGWIMGVKMDLNFHLFETAALCIAVLVVAILCQEGKGNYFKGVMLILCYLIVGASFFVHHDLSRQDNYTIGNL